MTIKPLDDKVIVEMPQDVNDEDRGSLIKLIQRHDKVVSSKIVAVGPGKVLGNGTTEKMLYEAGQTVYFPAECEKNSPRVKQDGKEYMVLIQEQVLCYRPKAEDTSA